MPRQDGVKVVLELVASKSFELLKLWEEAGGGGGQGFQGSGYGLLQTPNV